MRGAAWVALVAALVTGLLLLGENARLPHHEHLAAEEAAVLAGAGYDIAELESPRLAGLPLRLFAAVMRTPVLGRFAAKVLYRDNGMLDIRRLAAFVPDMPLYYPFIEPSPELMAATEAQPPLRLEAFSQQNAGVRAHAAAFKHWTIHDYTSRYAAGTLSPVEVAEAVLAAIEDLNSGPYAQRLFVELHPELVREQARASAARYAAGRPMGVLDGVPVAIKDEMEIEGHKMGVGTSFLGDVFGPAEVDAVPVARLRAAGAMILGKTNMHEIGLGITGYNKHHGPTRNPYDPQAYTGGSSSGSTVAVAAGLVPLAVGLDGGGSIRIPAALCGVVGIKPTFQRVPPLSPDCPSVSHVGPIAGNVRDAALGYAILSGGHESFARSLAQPPIRLAGFDATQSLRGLRVGYYGDYVNHSSPEIRTAVHDALERLRGLGAELVETPLRHLQAIHLAHALTITAEMAQNLDRFHSRFHEMSAEVEIMLNFARDFSSMDFLAAQRLRAYALRQLQDEVFSKVDVFVSPTTAITAPEIPEDAISDGELNTRQVGRIYRYSVYGNFVGNPGVTVPIAYDNRGLPISLQVQGNHWHEDVMLRVAHAVERLYEAGQKQPTLYHSIIDEATAARATKST